MRPIQVSFDNGFILHTEFDGTNEEIAKYFTERQSGLKVVKIAFENEVTEQNGSELDLNLVDLARLVFKISNRNLEKAKVILGRLLEFDFLDKSYMEMLNNKEHTPNCDGWCSTNCKGK